MTSGVYAIVNSGNGNCYIGSSANIETRWGKHIHLLNKGKHHSPHLQHAWSKYGVDSFGLVILLICERKMLLKAEQNLLDTLHPEYNVCVVAGSKSGTPRTDETKKKLSAANMGKKQSEETRRKRSLALKGRKRSDEFRKQDSISHTGILKGPHTDEAKRKISAAHKGKPLSEKNKRGISAAMIGNKNTLGKHWTWKKNAE